MTGISDYETNGDSTSMIHLGTDAFTIIGVEDSAYNNGTESTPGVKISLKDSITVKGAEYTKVHTTRKAIVSRLCSVDEFGKPANQKLHDALASGTELTVKCEQVPPEGMRKAYYKLVDA